MKITVRVEVDAVPTKDETAERFSEVFVLERDQLTDASVGLSLTEAHTLLGSIQEAVVSAQVTAAVVERSRCARCGRSHRRKDTRTITIRTLFGTLHLDSPRFIACPCRADDAEERATFSPLAEILAQRSTPELIYLQARFAAVMSFDLAGRLLGEVLPLGRTLHGSAVRDQVTAVARRLEGELGPERSMFAEGCQRDWEQLPRPDLPLVVGLDGGYVHSSAQTSRRDGWFEVIAGKSMPTDGPAKCFAFVQKIDTKPKRRLFEVLRGQGMQANQSVVFLTDGGEDIRDLPLYLNPHSEHYLDWFHITMRITVMANMAKSLRCPPPDPDLPPSPPRDLAAEVGSQLESLKWFLWHGNVFRALQTIGDLVIDLDTEHPDPGQVKLLKAVTEFDTYIRANADRIPNYGERRRCGETISTAFVESTVNQVVSKRMVKKQQMRWSPQGAHLFLQVRTRVLNNDLATDFARWHPGFTHHNGPVELLA
ncbi:MAG: ISKra4 family transposase [Pseudonocardiaceae bacterium]